MTQSSNRKPPQVALFVTCIADLFRPSVGFAAVELLEAAGCEVVVPHAQTCCGQPAYNSGARAAAIDLAVRNIALLEAFDHVVVPSGSCAAMIRCHYPELVSDRAGMKLRAEALAAKTHELTSFLYDIGGEPDPVRTGDSAGVHTITYHDACSGLRELEIDTAPRALLAAQDGVALIENQDRENCCGFGGTFCVKYSDISTRMADKKLDKFAETGADLVLGGDLGCLMHLAGRAKRRGMPLQFRHVVEVLRGEPRTPAIAEREE